MLGMSECIHLTEWVEQSVKRKKHTRYKEALIVAMTTSMALIIVAIHAHIYVANVMLMNAQHVRMGLD